MKLSTIQTGFDIVRLLCAVACGKRIPLYCEWEITHACNMQCEFCSTWSPARNAAADVSTEEALRIIDELSALGTRIIHFSGGEPTLRNDIGQLLHRAKKYGMVVSLTTNGSASSHKMEQLLVADIIRVSLDGSEEFHDLIRRTPGAYRNVLRVIEYLVSHNKQPLITTVFGKKTSYEMIREIIRVAQKFDIQVSIIPIGENINPHNDTDRRNDLSPTFVEYIALMKKLRREYGQRIANPEPFLTVLKNGGLDRYGCRAMDIALSIKADGSVSIPCTGHQQFLIKGNMQGIFYGEEALLARKQQGKYFICKGCNIRCMASASALLKPLGFYAIINSYFKSLLY